MSFLKKIQPFSLVYPSIEKTHTQILLIDNSLKDSDIFMNSVNTDTFPILYSASSSKTELLSLLQPFTSIERIAIVFTSTLGNKKLFLDNKPFFTDGSATDENVDFLISVIKELNVKNLDFLACDTLTYDNWVNFYHKLSEETGVTVGASRDKTGNIRYGGDWVMESTNEDVEKIYFTTKIEYYTYLLDNLSWSTGLYGPLGLVIYDDSMYVTSYGVGIPDGTTISQISLADGSVTNPSWASGLSPAPFSMTVYGDSMYVTIYNEEYDNGKISKISLQDGSIENDSWASELNSPLYTVVYDEYMYITNYLDGTISQVDLSGNIVKNDWASGFNGPFGLLVYDGYMYVSSNGYEGEGTTISQISLQDGSMIKEDWASGLSSPMTFVIYESYMYVGNQNDGTISQINTVDGSIVKYDWASGFGLPVGLLVYGTDLYVSDLVNGTISQLSLLPKESESTEFSFNATIQTMNNNRLSSEKAMPLKDSTSSGDSNFSSARHQYIESSQVSAQKKWIGGNRDASDRIRNLRVNAIGVGSLNASKEPMSFTSSTSMNTVREAKKRVRNGGATVPAKVTHKYANSLVFY